MDIYFRTAFKPVATILRPQETVNSAGQKVSVEGKGRHDPCVLPRAVPIVEAMTAMVWQTICCYNASTGNDMRKIALHWKILFGLLLGVIWALLSAGLGWRQFTLDWIKPWGTIFINVLKLIAVPLVLFSIIKGITDLSDISKIRRVGLKTIGIYVGTTVICHNSGARGSQPDTAGKGLGEEQLAANHEQFMAFQSGDDVSAVDMPTVISEESKDKVQEAGKSRTRTSSGYCRDRTR